MLKKRAVVFALLILIFSALVLSSCGKPAPAEAYLTGIEGKGFKTEYVEGDSLDLEGAELSLILSDGSKERTILSEDMIFGFSTALQGSYDLTVIYKNFSLKININVAAAPLYSVTFLAGGETVSGTPPTSYSKSQGANITLPENTFSLQGKKFDGWLANCDELVYASGARFVMPPLEVTFTAQWVDAPKELKIVRYYDYDFMVVIGIGTVTDTDIVIPSEYNGLPVTAINTEAFLDESQITSVTIPDSITAIGMNAFVGCTSLTTIYIPSSVVAVYTEYFYYYPPFFGCSESLIIYCGADSAPAGWEPFWNYYTDDGELTVVYGVTREEYEEVIK